MGARGGKGAGRASRGDGWPRSTGGRAWWRSRSDRYPVPVRRGPGRGRPLRDLRIGHPSAARGLGRAAGPGRRPRVHGHRRRRWATGSTGGTIGEPVVGGRRPAADGAGAASREAVPVRAPGAPSSTPRRRLRPLRAGRRRLAAPAARGARRPARRHWPSRWRWPSTASPGPGSAAGDTVMVIGAGPIGALSIAALVARGIGPVVAVEPGRAAPAAGPRPRRRRGARPRRPRDLPGLGAGARSPSGRSTSCSSAPGRKSAMEAGIPPAPAGRHPGPGGGGHRAPGVRPQPVHPQRAHGGGLLRLRPRRIRAGARRCWRGPSFPDRPAHRGRRRAPRRDRPMPWPDWPRAGTPAR